MSAGRWPHELLVGMLDLVFAPVCTACGGTVAAAAADRMVCGRCWARVRRIPHPRCARCHAPLPAGTAAAPSCRECVTVPGGVRVVRAAFVYDDTARALVHALKYRGWSALAAAMAARMAEVELPADVEEEARTVVPVPIGGARRRQRGYNQAELIARAFAERTGRRVDAGRLRRVRERGSQTTLHPSERRANVAGAFTATPVVAGGPVAEHLLLVDDVWTTGATALSCAQALLAAGVRAVSVLTFARALPELERETQR